MGKKTLIHIIRVSVRESQLPHPLLRFVPPYLLEVIAALFVVRPFYELQLYFELPISGITV